MVVRVHALGLLRFFPSDKSRAALMERATAHEAMAMIRAAALRGLAPFSKEPAVSELLKAALLDEDLRVSKAAETSLAYHPETFPVLEQDRDSTGGKK